MKSLRGWILITAFTIIFSSTSCADLVPYDPATTDFTVSDVEAMQFARERAQDPDLQFTALGVEMDPDSDFFGYILLRAVGSGQEFRVNLSTGTMLVPYDPNIVSYPINDVQAVQAARQWAQDSNLQLVSLGIEEDPCSLYKDCLFLRTGDNSEECRANMYTGEIVYWKNMSALKTYYESLEQLKQTPTLTEEQLETAAVAYLSPRYEDFNTLNMQICALSVAPMGGRLYMQRLPNDVWYEGTIAYCRMHEWSGQPLYFHGKHGQPVSISTEPVLTTTQAENIALGYVSAISYACQECEPPQLVPAQSAFILNNYGLWIGEDDLGAQRLRWEIQAVVAYIPDYDADDYYTELEDEEVLVPTGNAYDVYVDAITGEVFREEPAGLIGTADKRGSEWEVPRPSRPRPSPKSPAKQRQYEKGSLRLDNGRTIDTLTYPVLRNGEEGYLYAKYLPLLYGGTIEWKDRSARMVVAGRKVTLRPNRKEIVIDGKSIRLRHAPMIVAGRIYVPSEAIDAICGAEVTWDAQSKVLSIKSRDLPRKIRQRTEAISGNAR